MSEIENIVKEERKNDDERSLKSVLGSKVISQSGEIVGIVEDVVYNGYSIKGFLVKTPAFRKNVFIDKSFLDRFSVKGVMLNIDPVTTFIGKVVFDLSGRNIGKVTKVNRKDDLNIFNSLTVKKGVFGKEILISKSYVAVIKKNVILKVNIKG